MERTVATNRDVTHIIDPMTAPIRVGFEPAAVDVGAPVEEEPSVQ
jgi:hypothetical protein